jgi:hypothetical protein
MRRIQAGGLAVSAAIHLVALVLYPRLFGGLPAALDRGVPDSTRPPSGIEVLNLVETADAPEPAAVEPRPEPERQPTPVPQRPRREGPTRDVVPSLDRPPNVDGRSAAERLQPSTNEPRLWAALPEEITALTAEQRAENLLYARLQDLNDSAAAEAARAAAATDWTHTDANGNRWGVSPGKLHLGPITLPLPFSFGTPPGASDDLRRQQEIEAEIRRAAGQGAVDETVEERAKAIRERREQERRKTRPDTTVVR